MEITTAGAINLAGFVRATAGRLGTSADIAGGVAIAGPVAVTHSYVDTAIPTDVTVVPSVFFDAACSFFDRAGRDFVLWVPASSPTHLAEATSRGLVANGTSVPAMVASRPMTGMSDVRVELADNDSFEIVGSLCERGYEQPGMAWLMGTQQSYQAPNSYWHIAFESGVPVSAACGFLTGDTGGIYSVATPPECRRRGFAAAVTSAATNHLFELGATDVVLQASALGRGVYERLGFTTYDHYERFLVKHSPPTN